MRVEPVIKALTRHRCRFVVVGSVARALVGEDVVPHDLDLVVDASPERRAALVSALADCCARIQVGGAWVAIDPTMALPWTWGFRVRTPHGPVDVIVRFADGSTFDSLVPSAIVARAGDSTIRCRATRWAA